MPKKLHLFALLLIASFALFNWTRAENVYKCGKTYSQSPCPDAKLLQIDDARDPAQKKQTDEAALRDGKLADTMKKERLAEEGKALAAMKAARPAIAAKPTKVKTPVTKPAPKRVKPQSKKPDYFVAAVPGSTKKTSTKKITNKKKNAATPA